MSDFLTRINRTRNNNGKQSTINLKKGQRIDLRKRDNSILTSFCVGANWGAIKTTGFLGNIKITPVDLDLSAIVFDNYNKPIDIIYFGNLRGQGIVHYGDDLVGDTDGDDGLDNEIININLNQLPRHAEQVVFVLNSYNKQDFAIIPFASIRLYEGTSTKVEKVFSTYNISSDKKFSGHISMVLGKLSRHNNHWNFKAIGEPTRDKQLADTITSVMNYYL